MSQDSWASYDAQRSCFDSLELISKELLNVFVLQVGGSLLVIIDTKLGFPEPRLPGGDKVKEDVHVSFVVEEEPHGNRRPSRRRSFDVIEYGVRLQGLNPLLEVSKPQEPQNCQLAPLAAIYSDFPSSIDRS